MSRSHFVETRSAEPHPRSQETLNKVLEQIRAGVGSLQNVELLQVTRLEGDQVPEGERGLPSHSNHIWTAELPSGLRIIIKTRPAERAGGLKFRGKELFPAILERNLATLIVSWMLELDIVPVHELVEPPSADLDKLHRGNIPHTQQLYMYAEYVEHDWDEEKTSPAQRALGVFFNRIVGRVDNRYTNNAVRADDSRLILLDNDVVGRRLRDPSLALDGLPFDPYDIPLPAHFVEFVRSKTPSGIHALCHTIVEELSKRNLLDDGERDGIRRRVAFYCALVRRYGCLPRVPGLDYLSPQCDIKIPKKGNRRDQFGNLEYEDMNAPGSAILDLIVNEVPPSQYRSRAA